MNLAIRVIADKLAEDIIAVYSENITSAKVTSFGAVNNTGNLRSSLEKVNTASGFTIVGAKYFAQIRSGRRPGTRPPIAAIRAWAQQRGLPKGVEFAIANKIAQRGTQIYVAVGPSGRTVVFDDPRVDALVAEAVSQMRQVVVDEAEQAVRIGLSGV